MLAAVVFLILCTHAISVDWCVTKPSSGNFTLSAQTTCISTVQTIVRGSSTLSIIGEEKSLTSDLAIITQSQAANKDQNRLFWVQSGKLILAWVRITGGRVKESHDDTLSNGRANSGGLLYVGDGSSSNTLGPAIVNATFGVVLEGGRAYNGGGIAVVGSESLVWIGKSCSVVGNFAKVNGGAIYLRGSTFSMKESQVTGNTAASTGGGIYLHGSNLFMTTSLVNGNVAYSTSGGIFAQLSNFNAMESHISGNRAQLYAGIWLDTSSTLTATRTFINDNTATHVGGIRVSLRSTFNATLCHIDGNIAYKDAPGGLQIHTGSRFFGYQSTINHNRGGLQNGNGGGIYCDTQSAIEEEKKIGSLVHLKECDVKNNTAGQSGGGLYLQSNCTLRMANCNIMSNAGFAGNGGGVHTSGSNVVKIINTIIHNNKIVGGSGGGLYVTNFKKLYLIDSTFSKNSAVGFETSSGGGLFVSASDSINLVLASLLISENYVLVGRVIDESVVASGITASGGGMYLGFVSCELFEARSIIVTKNIARGQGGGIILESVNGSDTIFSDWNISNNIASTDGGGIALLGSTTVTFTGHTIINNNTARSIDFLSPGWNVAWYGNYEAGKQPRLNFLGNNTAAFEDIVDAIDFSDGYKFSTEAEANKAFLHGYADKFAAYFSGTLQVEKTADRKSVV